MLRLVPIVLLSLALAATADAAVELALSGEPPVRIGDVYLRDGVPYLPVDEVLPPLGLSGQWDSVEHVYRIRTPRGTAVISPGSHYLKLGERFVPLAHPPRFIDGRLRVAEALVATDLPGLLGLPVHYRNLDPSAAAQQEPRSAIDKLFAFLLRKKGDESGPALRAVAIDPGHGGQDPGAIGAGVKEKEVALAVARRLEKLVKMRLGIPVYLSRDGDYALEPRQRLETAARPDVDGLILLHAQASLAPQPHGVTLFVRPPEALAEGGRQEESLRLAELLAEALRGAGLEVAGVVQAPLLPLGRGDLPTVLVELGYLTHPGDRALLSGTDGQERLASALFAGLQKFANESKENHP